MAMAMIGMLLGTMNSGLGNATQSKIVAGDDSIYRTIPCIYILLCEFG